MVAEPAVDVRLHRFDLVFRTLLVIASISLSAGLSLYKDVLSPLAFLYSVVPLVLAVVFWSSATFHGGSHECIFKTVAWWTLMLAFVLLVFRLVFSFSYFLPPFVTTISVLLAWVLSRFLIHYFHGPDDVQLRRTMEFFMWAILVTLVVEMIVLAISLMRSGMTY
jgi:hypothetical protein